MANSSESNPLVENYNLSLDEQKKSIIQGMDNYVSSLETKLSSAKKELSKNSDELRTTSVKRIATFVRRTSTKGKGEVFICFCCKREKRMNLLRLLQQIIRESLPPPMGSLGTGCPTCSL